MIPRIYLLMVLTCFAVSNAQSQEITSLFSSSRISSTELSGKTLERFEKINSRPEVDKTRLVEMRNPVEMLKGRTFALDLTEDIRLIGTTLGFTEDSHGAVTWVGSFDSNPKRQTLTAGPNFMFGNIFDGRNRYIIEPIGESILVIYQPEIKGLPKEPSIDYGPKNGDSGDLGFYKTKLNGEIQYPVRRESSIDLGLQTNLSLEENSETRFSNINGFESAQFIDPPEIDILFLYTSDAKDAAGSEILIQYEIATAVNYIVSDIFDNTDIDVVVRKVRALETEYEEPSTGELDGADLIYKIENDLIDDIADTRDAWGADIIVVVVEDGFTVGSETGLKGWANEIGADESEAITIVMRQFLTSTTYTLAHEVAHLLGARHNNDFTSTPYDDGRGYVRTGEGDCTIMALECTRIAYFSSPSHYENSVVLGGEYNDATAVWEAAAPTAAAFRTAWEMSVENVTAEGPVYMEWHDYELLDGEAELFDPDGYVKDCDTDCSYQWYHRVPNGVWYEYGVATLDIYVLWNWTADHEFKLEVSHASGSSTSDPITISYCASPPCTSQYPKRGKELVVESSNLPTSFLLHNAYPNPFNPSTKIGVDVPEQAQVTIQVFDALGRFVAELANREFSAGKHQVTWSALGQPSGLYFIRMETENYLASQYVTLLK